MLTALVASVWPYLAAAFGLLVGLVAILLRRDRRTHTALDAATAQARANAAAAETLGEIINAPVTLDPVAARDRMRHRDSGTR